MCGVVNIVTFEHAFDEVEIIYIIGKNPDVVVKVFDSFLSSDY